VGGWRTRIMSTENDLLLGSSAVQLGLATPAAGDGGGRAWAADPVREGWPGGGGSTGRFPGGAPGAAGRDGAGRGGGARRRRQGDAGCGGRERSVALSLDRGVRRCSAALPGPVRKRRRDRGRPARTPGTSPPSIRAVRDRGGFDREGDRGRSGGRAGSRGIGRVLVVVDRHLAGRWP